jgi:hypothetical protein
LHKWSTNEPLSRLKNADVAAVDVNPAIPKPALLIPAERYSSGEWLTSLLKLPRSFTLRRIKSHLIANTVFSILVYIAYVIWPETMKALLKGMIPAPGPHLMLSGALGLLLVFRTNTAYDRYWEGRRHWGFLYSRTRDLSRLAHSVMRGKDREHFLQLVAATPPILLQHLRTGWLVGGKSPAGYNLDIETLVKSLLPKEDHAALLISNNRSAARCTLSIRLPSRPPHVSSPILCPPPLALLSPSRIGAASSCARASPQETPFLRAAMEEGALGWEERRGMTGGVGAGRFWWSR